MNYYFNDSLVLFKPWLRRSEIFEEVSRHSLRSLALKVKLISKTRDKFSIQ